MAHLQLHTRLEHWAFKAPIRITGYTFEALDVLVVTLTQEALLGRGEAAGVYYLDDHPTRMLAQVESLRELIESGIDRQTLRQHLPAGGARNAVDCALWELEAARAGRPVWSLANVERPRPLLTTYTIGADAPSSMAARAREFREARALKLKLTGEREDAARIQAVRAARPDVWLGVDANQGFTRAAFGALLPVLIAADVRLVEQPVLIGCEAELDGLRSPISIAADESVQALSDIPALVGRFDVVNIKLDKCGGLTEGLLMAQEAKRLGLKVMVGNMVGTSLATGPAYVLGQLCDVVDLDGSLALATDRAIAAVYRNGEVWCPDDVWGSPASQQHAKGGV